MDQFRLIRYSSKNSVWFQKSSLLYVSAKMMYVLRHSARCCHRTKRTCDVFPHLFLGFPLLLFPAPIPCIIVFTKIGYSSVAIMKIKKNMR